jgi:hypothetical protein
MIWYGYLGAAIVVVAEVLLFSHVEPVATYFTPIVWTGYILFADAVVLRLKGTSLIYHRRGEFAIMLPSSVVLWLIFEAYNLRLQNWEYIGLPSEWWQQLLGYVWSFATILPGIFETADIVEGLGLVPSRGAQRSIPTSWLAVSTIVGFLFVVIPPLLPMDVSQYLFGFVWLGFIFLLDPLNYRLGAPSLLRGWADGRPQKIVALLLSGLICGFLWEFWNYWAAAKWVYHVPILSQVKIFEMPILGFLGFPPFALECFAMYSTLRTIVAWPGPTRPQVDTTWP